MPNVFLNANLSGFHVGLVLILLITIELVVHHSSAPISLRVSLFLLETSFAAAHTIFSYRNLANAERWERVFREFSNARNDVLQKHVSSGNLGMAKGAKTLHLLRQVRERSRQRASKCVVASVLSPCRSSCSQAATRNACSEWKPRSLTATQIFSRSLAEGC